MSGFSSHTAQPEAIHHVNKGHGVGYETEEGQIPLTPEEFQKVPETILDADVVKYKPPSKAKTARIQYEKRFPDGTIIYVEEVQTRKGFLGLKTAYKKDPQQHATAPADSRLSEAPTPEAMPSGSSIEIIRGITVWRKGGTKSFSQASRGDFYPELKLIARWKSADRSTLLHETGHMFLEARMQAYADMLKRGGPKTEEEKYFAENMQKVLKFVGMKSPEQWQSMSTGQKRKGHEKFARSFEAWLMLGKAPSENLQGVFAQFASWLKKLYMCLSGIPGAQFDESVQNMFSNMFLAEAQIREAAIRQNVEALFATAEEAGMTPEEFESYHQSVNDMIAEAEAEQTERNTRLSERVNAMRRKALRELQGEVKGELKRIRDEEQKAFEATDTYKAWDKIHNGAAVGGKKVFFKLSMGELLALGFTKRQVEELHKAGLAVKQPRKGGLPIDDLAAGLNYPDAKTMVEDLLNNLKPKDVINQRAADRFVRENPELATPQRVQGAAGAAMFNDAKIKVLTAELKAFLRMARKQNVAINNEQMAVLAEEAVSKMKYADIKLLNNDTSLPELIVETPAKTSDIKGAK